MRESVAEVLRGECDLERVHAYFTHPDQLSKNVWQLATELGWLRLGISDASGGLGMGAAGLAMLAEELGGALAPGPFVATLATAQMLDECAPSSIKDRYLPAISAGELTVAMDTGMHGALELSGERTLLGEVDAGMLLVLLPPQDGADRALGLIDVRDRTGLLQPAKAWDRTRGLYTASIPQDAEVHRLDDAASRRLVQLGALMIAGDSLGLLGTIIRQTTDYLCTREQFGVKIGSFQALKHRMADLFVDQQLKRCLIEEAQEWDADTNAPGTELWALLCKAEITDAAVFAAVEALQLHGGIGFTWEHSCHILLKRARLNQALLGNNDALRAESADLLAARMTQGHRATELAS